MNNINKTPSPMAFKKPLVGGQEPKGGKSDYVQNALKASQKAALMRTLAMFGLPEKRLRVTTSLRRFLARRTTSIEWTDRTWNPTRGCTKCSPGCAGCYAKVFAERWVGIPGHAYEHGFEPRLVPEKLNEPLKWRTPSMIFVNSMSDLFHDDFPEEYIERVAQTMEAASWHTFQVLTKRAERMATLLSGPLKRYASLKNVWWGVSVENQKHGLPRIDHLRRVPTNNRFLSVEPLLEDLGQVDLAGITWVIVGGESGHGARPLAVAWVRSLRDQCSSRNIPFLFKQWGGVNKKAAGRLLDGKVYDENPSRPSLQIKPVVNLPRRR